MIEIIVFALFFGAIVVGSLVAWAFGKLPDAEQLEVEDRRRWERYERDL
jgi:hypothetical protein